MHGSGVTATSGTNSTTLIVANEDMNDIMKIIEALENSGILLKGVTKTIENETKEQKGGFFINVIGYFRSFFIKKFVIRWKRNSTCR